MKIQIYIAIVLIILNFAACVISTVDNQRANSKLLRFKTEVAALVQLAAEKDPELASNNAASINRAFSGQLQNYIRVSELNCVSIMVLLVALVGNFIRNRKQLKNRSFN